MSPMTGRISIFIALLGLIIFSGCVTEPNHPAVSGRYTDDMKEHLVINDDLSWEMYRIKDTVPTRSVYGVMKQSADTFNMFQQKSTNPPADTATSECKADCYFGGLILKNDTLYLVKSFNGLPVVPMVARWWREL